MTSTSPGHTQMHAHIDTPNHTLSPFLPLSRYTALAMALTSHSLTENGAKKIDIIRQNTKFSTMRSCFVRFDPRIYVYNMTIHTHTFGLFNFFSLCSFFLHCCCHCHKKFYNDSYRELDGWNTLECARNRIERERERICVKNKKCPAFFICHYEMWHFWQHHFSQRHFFLFQIFSVQTFLFILVFVDTKITGVKMKRNWHATSTFEFNIWCWEKCE